MKTKSILLIVLSLVIITFQLKAQWTQKSSFPDSARRGAVCFCIGTSFYIGTGFDGELYKDFWKYDIETDSWAEIAEFPGAARWDAVAFSIGSKGYVGTGYTGSTFKRDFWEYDPETNTWTQKANFGGPKRRSAVGFSIGTYGYIGTGYGTPSGTYYNDFWEYDPEHDIWNQIADLPGTPRDEAVGFSIGEKGYVGTGYDFYENYHKDFWEYNPENDTWEEKSYFGGVARTGAIGFSVGQMGYIGTGLSGSFPYTEHKDFWEYNPAEDTWTQMEDFAGEERWEAIGCATASKAFIGLGQGSTSYPNDFWEFSSDTGTYYFDHALSKRFNVFPNPFKGSFTVELNETATIRLTDIHGECVYSCLYNAQEKRIDLSNLISGVYFLEVRTEKEVYVKKIVKQ